MKSETLEKVMKLIGGATPEELDLISEAYQSRRQVLRSMDRQRALATIEVGSAVRLKNIKPKYLNGQRAKVIGRKGTKFIIRLEPSADPRAFARFGPEPLCPATTLELIDA